MAETPRGALVAIGGNEDKTADKAVLRRVLELPTRKTRHVEIIPTASRLVEEVSADYLAAFKDLGVEQVGVLDIREREDADREDFAKRVHDCDVVYLTGGDQLRLTSVLGGTRTARAILDTYMDGGVVAGTSAGAAAMSTTMIAGGDNGSAMRKGSVQMTPGLGLVRDCIIDTHFLDRGRVGRLLEVVLTNPGYVGLGVGEDTGILILEGERVEAIGTGVVVVVEGHEMRSSNVSAIGPNDPIAAERLIVHSLARGYAYNLRTREYRRPDGEEKAERSDPETREPGHDGEARPGKGRSGSGARTTALSGGRGGGAGRDDEGHGRDAERGRRGENDADKPGRDHAGRSEDKEGGKRGKEKEERA